MDDKIRLKEIVQYLDKNGFYKLERDSNARDIYTKIIDYYKTKTTVRCKSNILQLKNIVGQNGEFIADIKHLDSKRKGFKKSCLELRDKKILALLKDYEYMLKGSLKYLEDVYSKLYEMGISEVDYSKPIGEDCVEELYQFITRSKVDRLSIEQSIVEDQQHENQQPVDQPVDQQPLEDLQPVEEEQLAEDQKSVEDLQHEEFVGLQEELIKDVINSHEDIGVGTVQSVDEDKGDVDLGVSEDVYIEEDYNTDEEILEEVYVEDEYIETPVDTRKGEEDNEPKEDIRSLYIEDCLEQKDCLEQNKGEGEAKKFKFSSQEATTSGQKESNERLKIGQKQKKINFANLLVYSRFD